MRRRIKNALKAGLYRGFTLAQRLGVDILPRHFYSEIPFIHQLRHTRGWREPFSMVDVQGVDLDSQEAFLTACCPRPLTELLRQRDVHQEACRRHGEAGFGPVEADVLFGFVATRRPPAIVQIGCGVSTVVCLLAAEHAGYRPTITCIEPFPNRALTRLAEEAAISLVKEKAQDVGLSVVETLGRGDLFFVDSSHALGPAGEVTRIILEMLPRLRKGAFAHFHDIRFPYDYSRGLLDKELFFQHESPLLHAFLAGNARFRIAASLSMLHYARPDAIGRLVPRYRPCANADGLAVGTGHFPSSTYLEVVA